MTNLQKKNYAFHMVSIFLNWNIPDNKFTRFILSIYVLFIRKPLNIIVCLFYGFHYLRDETRIRKHEDGHIYCSNDIITRERLEVLTSVVEKMKKISFCEPPKPIRSPNRYIKESGKER